MKNKFLSFIKNKWKMFFSLIFITVISLYVVTFAIKRAKDFEVYKEPQIETKIYSVWHVETFEGGGISRVNYLKSIARDLEKKHAGMLFMIRTISPENLSAEIEAGVADIISFGFGVGNLMLNSLVPFETTYDVRDELVESGSFLNKVYALPYIASGYAFFSEGEKTDKCFAGTSEYINIKNVCSGLNLTANKQQTCYEAYKDFVYSTSGTLVGTGRDLFRVNNLNSLGRKHAEIKPIDSYTDLMQYVGVTKTDEIILEFLSEIFSVERQNKLVDYSLFSVKYNKIYSSGIYSEMEDAIFRCEVAKVFNDK